MAMGKMAMRMGMMTMGKMTMTMTMGPMMNIATTMTLKLSKLTSFTFLRSSPAPRELVRDPTVASIETE